MRHTHTKVWSFELNGVEIKTTVTDDERVIDDHISSFLHPTNNHGTKVIGFDIEWSPIFYGDYDETNNIFKPAVFQLCDGYRCLIIDLHSQFDVPLSLLNFLHQPNYTFVGYRVKDNFVNLEKHLGIRCRNAVELGSLAANLMNAPHLRFCGVDELAFVVNKLDLRKYRPLSMNFNWGDYPIKEELAKLATVNVYSYQKIGSKLFGRYILDNLALV